MKIVIALLCIISNLTMVFAGKFIGGDESNRILVTRKVFNESNDITKTLILRSAKVVNTKKRHVGSAFLIKESATSYQFLTNFHVMNGNRDCLESKIVMVNSDFSRKVFKCFNVISVGSYKENTDYTIFTIKKSSNNSFLSNIEKIKVASEIPDKGQRIALVGFGGASATTTKFKPHLSLDEDCVILNDAKSIKFNKETMKNVIFTASDVESGDSGSAMINYDTGEVVGLFFGTAIPKKKDRLTSAEIWQNLGTPYRRFYTHSSMAIDINSIDYMAL